MRTLVMLMRPFRRSLGSRIAMQLLAIGCLFLLICLHLQYEFANNRGSASASSTKPYRRSSSRSRKYDKRFPTDDDNTLWYAGMKEAQLLAVGRAKRDEDDVDDETEFLYIDINDEQKNSVRTLDQVGGDPAGMGVLPRGRGSAGGSGGNLAGVMGQYQVGRKALLSKRISSVGEEYPVAPGAAAAAIESDEKSYAGLPLQPWASRDHSMDSEARRFFKYITTTQVQCQEQQAIGSSNPAGTGKDWPWMVCFDAGSSYASRGALRPGCVVYSFGVRSNNIRFETEMAERGCEVHIFDPSGRVRSQVTAAAVGVGSNHGNSGRRQPQQLKQEYQLRQRQRQSGGSSGVGGAGSKKPSVPRNIVFHRTTLDWRDADDDAGEGLAWRPKKLSAIMSMLGHETIDIVRADLQSAEWKVLESLLLDGTASHIHQLLFNVHLNWSGFEVQGANRDVIRFWYSVLRELETAGFGLFHTWEDKAEPPIFLGQTRPDISSTYALGWINSAWR